MIYVHARMRERERERVQLQMYCIFPFSSVTETQQVTVSTGVYSCIIKVCNIMGTFLNKTSSITVFYKHHLNPIDEATSSIYMSLLSKFEKELATGY